MNSIDRKLAVQLQEANIQSEADALNAGERRCDIEVNQAIVATRQDVTMIVSYLDSQSIRQEEILKRLTLLVGLHGLALAAFMYAILTN